MSSAIENLQHRFADLNALRSAIAIMDWDQQTFMPRGGADARANHVGVLSRLYHEMFTGDETRRFVEAAKSEAEDDEAAMIRVFERDLDRATKIPTELVEEKTKLAARGHEIWVKARANSDFKSFAPVLERMFEIARQEAEYLGYKDHIYDALLDLYEEGATAADARAMFEAIKGPQVELVQAIGSKPQVDDSFLYGEWNVDSTREFTEATARAVGFDFTRGRQDTAPHPFCTSWSIGDVRITTRYERYLATTILSTMHESGHGMYEQGVNPAWDRTPLEGGVSLGIHESQSRLWEGIVGRSRPFWRHFLPGLQAHFPALQAVDLESFYRAINRVEPSLIRVEADELTYNLHVLTRFELECDLLTGALAVRDLPEAWNAKYEAYLGVRPKNDAEGCLQDVHWSQGSIGYFPTYSMGNLLSYQFWAVLRRELGDTDRLIADGQFTTILQWLRDNIYFHGRKYPPKELVRRVTGKPMGATDYLEGLQEKYKDIYRL